MAPFVIPGIVMAIGFYAAYAGPPLSLYGSAALIILAFTTRFLPIAYANPPRASLRSLHPEMEEAVRILGGGALQRASARWSCRCCKKPLLGGWLLVFIIATRELSAAVFLAGPQHADHVGAAARPERAGQLRSAVGAMAASCCVITLVLVGIGMKLAGRDFMLRRH